MRRVVLLAVLLVGALACASASDSLSPLSSRLSSGSRDSGYPVLGQLAIGLLVGLVITAALCSLVYVGGCCCARHHPTPGAALLLGVPFDASRTRNRRVMLVCVAGVSLILKLVALGLDQWSQQSFSNGTIYFGVERSRWMNEAIAYSETCAEMREEGEPHPHAFDECRTLRASGAITLALGIMTAFGSLHLVISYLRALGGHALTGPKAVSAWRGAGLTFVWSITCPLAWLISAHLIIIDMWNVRSMPDGPELGASVSMMLATPVIDAFALYLARDLLLNFQGEGAAAHAPAHFAVVAAPGMAYQQLGQPVMAQPVGYMPPQPMPHAPVYPLDQPQQMAYPPNMYPVMQQQQHPPAYAPPQPR